VCIAVLSRCIRFRQVIADYFRQTAQAVPDAAELSMLMRKTCQEAPSLVGANAVVAIPVAGLGKRNRLFISVPPFD
jgi:hypothetical protein